MAEEVRLQRIWACVDAGLVINPDGAASQVEGAIVLSRAERDSAPLVEVAGELERAIEAELG